MEHAARAACPQLVRVAVGVTSHGGKLRLTKAVMGFVIPEVLPRFGLPDSLAYRAARSARPALDDERSV